MINSQTFVTVRGGSWSSHIIRNFRSSHRAYLKYTDKVRDIGFRCAK